MNKEKQIPAPDKVLTPLGLAFVQLSPRVKSEDVARAMIKFSTSDTTIWRYCSGSAPKEEWGKKLYKFLSDCIIARESETDKLVA